MDDGDFKRGPDPRRSIGGQFKPGHDPRRNNGGRPKIANDLEAIGFTTAEARQRWWQLATKIAFAGPQEPNDPNWRYAHEQVGNRLMGKPTERVEHSVAEPQLTDAEIKAELDEIVREKVAAMSAEERMKLLADPAPSSTIQ